MATITLGTAYLSNTEMTSLTQTQSFANGELIGSENDVVATTGSTDPNLLSVGDTLSLGGVPYTIVEESGGFSTIEYDDGTGVQTAQGNVSQLELSDGTNTIFASLIGGWEGQAPTIPAGSEILGYTPDPSWSSDDPWSFDNSNWSLSVGPGSDYDYGTVDYAEPTAPCFTPGNMIETPEGLRDVDELVAGDLVMTKDRGAQPVRWVFKRDLTPSFFRSNPDLVPVIVAQDALGKGNPSCDTKVSPGHMFLLNATDENGAVEEVLVPARQLVESGAARLADTTDTAYIHLMFDQHEIVNVDGAWSESFRPGPASVQFMGSAARHELARLFPELTQKGGLTAYKAARTPLYRGEARHAITKALNLN